MAIAQDRKNEIVKEYAQSEGDNGSVEVQVALLTEHISGLTEHLKVHKHDRHSRRGLIMLVGKRNRHLKFLARINREAYQNTIKKLGLRK